MIDFSNFDEEVKQDELNKQIKEAQENQYEEVPDGTYIVGIEKMELRLTKTDQMPMFSVQLRIKEGKYKKQMLFFNRKIKGNKQTERWNDGKAIQTVVTWVNKLEPEIPFAWTGSYQRFAEDLLDIYQEVQGNIELKVEYKKDAFNCVTIREIYDLA